MRLRVLRREPSAAAAPPGEPVRPTPRWRRLARLLRNREIIGALTRNPGLKVLSLLLAFFLWYSVNVSERNAEGAVDLPVRVEPVTQGLIVTDVPTKLVTITLRGPSSMLDSVNAQRRRLTIDLSAATPGENQVEVTADMIRPELPRRVKVLRFEPAHLVVRAERVVRVPLPVKVDLAGQPALGYTVADVSVKPETVSVSGPGSVVNELKEIKTERVALQRSSAEIERSVLLSSPGQFLTFVPDRVTVTVSFQQLMASRIFENVTVEVRQGSEGGAAELTPKSVELTLTGPQLLLGTFDVPPGSVYVEAADLGPGKHRVVPKVELPQGLEVTRREPEFLVLEIKKGAD